MSGNELESAIMNARAQTMAEAIIADGYRLTAARQTVIACLVQSGGHISADDLAAQVHAAAPQVGRMTVYRTLELLSKLGQIQPIYQGTGAAHYVLMEAGSHHHLVCNRCHVVIDFDDCLEAELARFLADKYAFQVQSHVLEIHGICQQCAESPPV